MHKDIDTRPESVAAQAKRIGALGTRIKIDHYGIFSCPMRFAALFARTFPREISHYVSGFQFADKSFHRCALCFLFNYFILF